MVKSGLPIYSAYNSLWSVGSFDQGIPIYNDRVASLGYQEIPDVSLINNLNGLQGYYFSNKKSRKSKRKLRKSKRK